MATLDWAELAIALVVEMVRGAEEATVVVGGEET